MRKTKLTRRDGSPTYRFHLSEAEAFRMSDEGTGLCVGCGKTRESCEPDARRYPCDACGESRVYGVEECVLRGYAAIGGR